MIRIAICDDDTAELNNTQAIVNDFILAASNSDITVRSYRSSFELLDDISKAGGYDIYLLDIMMPNISGIELGESIRQTDDLAIIIYTTFSEEFALKSYSVFAFHYLLKPILPQQLHSVLFKALKRIDQEKRKVILLKTKDGSAAILYHQIIFVEYSNHKLRFHLTDGTTAASVILRDPFETTANELLKDRRFVRPHVSYIINMNQIRTITGKDITMTNGGVITISRKYLSDTKKTYMDFLFSQGEPLKL